MTTPIPPSLERFGDDLDRAAHRELSIPSGPVLARVRRPRPRLFAGGTLGLAGVGAAVLLALSGTAATSPAYAITQNDGSVLVKFNFVGQQTYSDVDQQLTAKYHEEILVSTAPGPATVKVPLNCTVTPVPGVQLPSGPAVRVLLGNDGTAVMSSGNTGAGLIHLTSCGLYYNSGVPGADGTGNTGSMGNS